MVGRARANPPICSASPSSAHVEYRISKPSMSCAIKSLLCIDGNRGNKADQEDDGSWVQRELHSCCAKALQLLIYNGMLSILIKNNTELYHNKMLRTTREHCRWKRVAGISLAYVMAREGTRGDGLPSPATKVIT